MTRCESSARTYPTMTMLLPQKSTSTSTSILRLTSNQKSDVPSGPTESGSSYPLKTQTNHQNHAGALRDVTGLRKWELLCLSHQTQMSKLGVLQEKPPSPTSNSIRLSPLKRPCLLTTASPIHTQTYQTSLLQKWHTTTSCWMGPQQSQWPRQGPTQSPQGAYSTSRPSTEWPLQQVFPDRICL